MCERNLAFERVKLQIQTERESYSWICITANNNDLPPGLIRLHTFKNNNDVKLTK